MIRKIGQIIRRGSSPWLVRIYIGRDSEHRGESTWANSFMAGCGPHRPEAFTVATDVKAYLCDPQVPGQRGMIENINRPLRQNFPRGANLSSISQAQLDQISLRLNQRPREALGFQTPASRLQAGVGSTD